MPAKTCAVKQPTSHEWGNDKKRQLAGIHRPAPLLLIRWPVSFMSTVGIRATSTPPNKLRLQTRSISFFFCHLASATSASVSTPTGESTPFPIPTDQDLSK